MTTRARPGRGEEASILEVDVENQLFALSHDRNVMQRDAVIRYSDRLENAYKQKDRVLATSEGREEELHAYNQASVQWRFYRTLCQVRFGYLSFLVVMMVLMFSFTLLMEIFFSIFLPSAKYDEYYTLRAVVLLVLLPVVLFILSYIFEEASRLFLDALNKSDGSLPNFRLALAVVIHNLRHRRELLKIEELVDVDQEESTLTVGDKRRISQTLGGKDKAKGSLLLTAETDPFSEDYKAEEDELWDRTEAAVAEAIDARLARPSTVGECSPKQNALKRWKRVQAAVKTTVVIQNVQEEGPAIDLSTFVAVDVVCPVLFEILTACSMVVEFAATWSMPDAFLVYVQTGFWSVGVYLMLWMIAHFWSSRNDKMRMIVSNYRRRRRILRRAVCALEEKKRAEHLWLLDVGFRFVYHVGVVLHPTHWLCFNKVKCHKKKQSDVPTDGVAIPVAASRGSDVDAGQSRATSAYLSHRQQMQEFREWIRARNPWHRLSINIHAVLLLVLVVVSALVSLKFFFIGWPIMGMCLIALSSVVQRRFPQIFGQAFRKFISAFVVVSLVFFSSSFIIGTFVSGGVFKLGPFDNSTEQVSSELKATHGISASVTVNGKVINFDATSQYAACSISYQGLSVLDLALVADAAYGLTTDTQRSALGNRFNGTQLDDWKYVARNNESTDGQTWMEIYFPAVNMTVIAVRGTASTTEALEDMHFWFGISIMQAANIFVPFLKQLPRAFVVRMLSMRLISSVMPSPVYTDVLNHAVDTRARVGENLVITGHSLGGAIAAMIGAKTKTSAVSFSGPGLLYSLGRFDITSRDVRDYVLTMKPKKDIVPRVDQLGGLVQEIRCKKASPMGCHSMSTHLCELYFSCGDLRHRNWSKNQQCIAYNALTSNDDDDE
uniref:Fungal lipase-type domain-containing protein n=1 Tax=Hyaloperonospora arabidopsidis (strain Emoy2) TaxID=559515 RepID=M4B9B3_HYAAE